MERLFYFVSRVIDRGTKTERHITFQGPFKSKTLATTRLRTIRNAQPQFDFIIEAAPGSNAKTGTFSIR